MEEYSYEVKIPKERVAVLIGRKGEVKKDIEQATKSKIKVDSKEGDIAISGNDSIGLLSAKEIVLAIGRGFNPEIAMLLLKQDYSFELISMADFAGKSKNKLARLKGRVIGSEGKSRKTIEALTETYLSIYGKTIGIIGEVANVSNARIAIEKILSGAQHSGVYKWLERERKDLKMQGFGQLKIKEDD